MRVKWTKQNKAEIGQTRSLFRSIIRIKETVIFEVGEFINGSWKLYLF